MRMMRRQSRGTWREVLEKQAPLVKVPQTQIVLKIPSYSLMSFLPGGQINKSSITIRRRSFQTSNRKNLKNQIC